MDPKKTNKQPKNSRANRYTVSNNFRNLRQLSRLPAPPYCTKSREKLNHAPPNPTGDAAGPVSPPVGAKKKFPADLRGADRQTDRQTNRRKMGPPTKKTKLGRPRPLFRKYKKRPLAGPLNSASMCMAFSLIGFLEAVCMSDNGSSLLVQVKRPSA